LQKISKFFETQFSTKIFYFKVKILSKTVEWGQKMAFTFQPFSKKIAIFQKILKYLGVLQKKNCKILQNF